MGFDDYEENRRAHGGYPSARADGELRFGDPPWLRVVSDDPEDLANAALAFVNFVRTGPEAVHHENALMTLQGSALGGAATREDAEAIIAVALLRGWLVPQPVAPVTTGGQGIAYQWSPKGYPRREE